MENLEIIKQPEIEIFEELKIRSELNIEKWSIWTPSQSHKKLESKILEREIKLSNGSIGKAKVEIVPTTRGNLTTQDQKVFYALIKIWEEKGKSETYTYVSLKKLAKVLKTTWGSATIKSLTNSIDRLRLTHFVWEQSYFNAETKETIEVMEDPFTILSDRKLIKTHKDGHLTREEGYFKFHQLILKNLLSNYTKPVLFDVVISFRSEIAQLLYSKVDLFLTDKPRFERRTKELFEDLGLEGVAYKYSSKRKQMLQPALKELLGKPLSSGGVIGKADLVLTKDEQDFKVVFEKRARLKKLQEPETVSQINETENEAESLFIALREYGVTESKAKDLIKRARIAVESQILFYPYATLAPTVKNPSGWIIKAIENNYAPPESFKKEQAKLEARRKEEAKRKTEDSKFQKELKEYEEAERKKELARGKFESFSKERQLEIYQSYYDKITKRDYRPDLLDLPTFKGLIEKQVYSEIYADVSKGKIL